MNKNSRHAFIQSDIQSVMCIHNINQRLRLCLFTNDFETVERQFPSDTISGKGSQNAGSSDSGSGEDVKKSMLPKGSKSRLISTLLSSLQLAIWMVE